MPNSDIALGWVDDNGMAYLQDRYTTTTRITPLYDSTQSLTLIEGEEVDGMTRLRWTRDKYSCEGDDMSISQGTTRYFILIHTHIIEELNCLNYNHSLHTDHTSLYPIQINLGISCNR